MTLREFWLYALCANLKHRRTENPFQIFRNTLYLEYFNIVAVECSSFSIHEILERETVLQCQVKYSRMLPLDVEVHWAVRNKRRFRPVGGPFKCMALPPCTEAWELVQLLAMPPLPCVAYRKSPNALALHLASEADNTFSQPHDFDLSEGRTTCSLERNVSNPMCAEVPTICRIEKEVLCREAGNRYRSITPNKYV